MADSSFTASRLKAELLGVLDRVEASGEAVTVTKHGRPVARLVPIEDDAPLAGSVRVVDQDDDLLSVEDGSWDAERG